MIKTAWLHFRSQVMSEVLVGYMTCRKSTPFLVRKWLSIRLSGFFWSSVRIFFKIMTKQECIPVGCVPSTCCPYLPACTAPGGCTCQRGVPASRVYLLGVPAWGVCLPGGVPARGLYLPRGVPARGCTCQRGVPVWGLYLPGGCTCLGVYLPRECTCLGVSASVHAGIHTPPGLDSPGCGPGHPPARPPNLPLGLGLDTHPCEQNDWQTDLCKNITFANFICGQ